MQCNEIQCDAIQCNACYMLHVTYHTCYMSQISSYKNFNKNPLCHIFLESPCKIHFNGHDKILHVACHTCYMSQISS